MIIPLRWWLPVAVAATAAIVGACAALHYHQIGLTLSHYDARGHLVVSRRIIDSLTPGWQQIGAVWLPLPHLLNALPVQSDLLYRTGLSAVALSVAAFAVAAGVIAWMVLVLTGSAWAAAGAAAVFVLNPNVLYLQATPMTEPLMLAFTLAAIAALIAWCERPERPTLTVGLLFAAACLTRYEAWPVTALAIPAAAWARWRSGRSLRDAVRDLLPVAAVPAGAAIAFMVFSRVVVGEWFVSNGFFVPDQTFASPLGAAAAVWEGTVRLSGRWILAAATAGVAVLLVRSVTGPTRAQGLVALALAGTAALPWLAFLQGHPFRVRYMVPLLAVEAVGAGVFAGVIRRAAPLLMAGLLALALVEPGPLAPDAPMVVEAQWDRPHAAERRRVTTCLAADYRGETIMASMGSLGHYMQDLASAGFAVRDFLHEGNGDIWLNALDRPEPFVGWILIEEEAEGGDMLAQTARRHPAFLQQFTRVCQGGGVALYRRAPEPDMPPASGAHSERSSSRR